jgi:acetyl-CoA carboxylase / biotin carboxylase 1
MKMYMPLTAAEDGIVQFVKQPGVSLEPGDILGILTLDDPARVKHAKPFEGLLPPMGNPAVSGNKPHQKLAYCLGILNDILDGFDNQAIMASTFKDLLDVLNDPELPFSQTSAILSTLSGRMPQKLEDSVRSAIDSARTKTESLEFPAVRIKKLLEHFVQDNVRPQDRAVFHTQLASLFDVVERFQGGLKAHQLETLAGLLAKYEQTEKLFGGSIEARVLQLREQYKDDLDKVAGLVLSHIMTSRKAKLVMAILDHVKNSGLTVTNPESSLYQVLQGLASLENR